jgi:ABC-type transporter Mla subunit MlaD
MERGSDDVRTGVAGADQAGKALDEIISMASNVGDMVTQIATAATEQSSTSESINANVENITGMIRTSENAAQETANACSDLTTLIMELQEVIGHFRIAQLPKHERLLQNAIAPGKQCRGPFRSELNTSMTRSCSCALSAPRLHNEASP